MTYCVLTPPRVGLGISYDPKKLERDVARSLELQNQLWQQAMAVTAAGAAIAAGLSLRRLFERDE